MQRYLVRRLGTFLITLWFVLTLAYVALTSLHGDPAVYMLGVEADEQALAALRREMGLDAPPLQRYVSWLQDVLRGDLGRSVRYNVPVVSLIAARLSITLPLAFGALLFALAVALPLGVLAATRQGRVPDLIASLVAQAGIATPPFWLGMMLILVFSVRLGWVPSSGFTPWEESFSQAAGALVLPVIALGASRAAALTRMVRAATLELLHENWVRTAEAKGLSPRRVLWVHIMRGALVSISTLLGLELGFLVAGSIVIETVFALPGLGALALAALEARDLPTIQGVVFLMTGVSLALSLLVDLAYAYLDPRIRYS